MLEHQELSFKKEFRDGHQLLYEQAYRELCETVTGEEPSEIPPNEDDFAELVLKFLNENRERVHDAVCVEFEYCEKMKKYGFFAIPVPLLFSLAGILADVILACGFASTCWLTVKGLLDQLCECGATQKFIEART